MRILYHAPRTDPAPWIDALRAALPGADVREWSPGAPAADYAVVWGPQQQFFDEQPQLRAVFNTGAGVDALLPLRIPPGTLLVRLDDAGMAVQMAEYVCQAVIRHFRAFDACEADMRAGRWSPRATRERKDFPCGVMGLGALGTRVARALQHFEFPVLGWSRTPRQLEGVRCYAGRGQLDDFLAATRVLVCLLPLTDDTRDLLDRRTLGRLMPGACLVNVARGALVVDEDLLALLDAGHLAGATLDVFRQEPLPPEHPFWRHPKLTLTPHTSARTLVAESVAQIVGKIRALERGEPVAGVVDRARGY